MRDSSHYGFNGAPIKEIGIVLLLIFLFYGACQVQFPSQEEVQQEVLRKTIKTECLK